MGWLESKAALGTALAGTSISVDLGEVAPFEQDIKTVFTEPPPSIEKGQLPAILLGDAPFEDEWDSALAVEDYEVEGFLFLRHEDVQRAVVLSEAWRQSVKDVLRANVKVGRSDTTLHGVRFGRLAPMRYAGGRFLGFRFTVALAVHDASPGFAAG